LLQFIENLKLDFLDYICSSKGCHEIQKYLKRTNPSDMNKILYKIGDNLQDIMIDPYANYFFQKITNIITIEQRIYIFQNIQKSFITIATNMSGTHSLQALVVSTENLTEIELIIDSVVPMFTELCFVFLN